MPTILSLALLSHADHVKRRPSFRRDQTRLFLALYSKGRASWFPVPGMRATSFVTRISCSCIRDGLSAAGAEFENIWSKAAPVAPNRTQRQNRLDTPRPQLATPPNRKDKKNKGETKEDKDEQREEKRSKREKEPPLFVPTIPSLQW